MLPAVLEQFSVGTIAVAADALEDAPAEGIEPTRRGYRQVRRWGYGRHRLICARVMWPFRVRGWRGQ